METVPFWILLRGIQNGLVTAFSGEEYVVLQRLIFMTLRNHSIPYRCLFVLLLDFIEGNVETLPASKAADRKESVERQLSREHGNDDVEEWTHVEVTAVERINVTWCTGAA